MGAVAAPFRPDAVLARLKREISRPGDRRSISLAWNPPPAYAASTAYETGNRVVNGGNIYGAIAPGTTGASSAPTGTGSGPITDGTVTWYYVGPTFTADVAAPTYSTSTTSPATAKFYRPTASTFASGSATVVTNDGWYSKLGFFGPNAGGIGGFGASGFAGGFEFMTDDTQISIARPNSTGDWGPIIEVDGRYLVDGVISQAATSGQTFTTITFPSRKPRRVAVRYRTNNSVVTLGVFCTAVGTLWQPPKRDGGLKGQFIGDSFAVSGTGFFGENADRGIASTLFDQLGIDDFYLDAIGGTGFTNGSFVFGSATRLAFVSGYLPDVVVAMTSINDVSATQASLNAAQAAWRIAVRQSVPNAWIVMLGSMARTTTVTNIETWTQSWVAATGDPKMIFIPAGGDAAGPWATGTGTTTTTTGVGNGDLYWASDNVHPVQRGQDYLGKRAGKAIAASFASL